MKISTMSGPLGSLFLVLIFLTAGAQMTYNEDFDLAESWGGGSAGSYTYKTYVNPGGPLNDQFSSDNAVRESSGVMTGYAWRLRNEGAPYFLYECEAPVSGFSVFLAHWNPSIPMDVTIECSMNSGLTYETLIILDETWWTDQGLGEKEYQEFSSGDISLVPDPGDNVHIRILSDGGERLLIDNFQLVYDNGSAGVENPQDFAAIPASESQIDLVFVPNLANDEVVIVYDENGTFDVPYGMPPAVGQPFAGGTLIYQGTTSPQSHAGLSPLETVHYRAWSFDGTDYSSGLEVQATTAGPSLVPNAWINEIHYDNDGGDVDEFIEVAVENYESFNLADLEVYLYNGSDGTFYASETVDQFEMGTNSNNMTFFTWFYPGIQNGAPEGVALASGGQLVEGQFVSYEGVFAATNGPASGMYSVDMGVYEPATTPVGFSLQLTGSGTIYEHFTWSGPSEDTPGALNFDQGIGYESLWTGEADTDWHNETNWSSGVPDDLASAVIPVLSLPDPYYPVIAGSAEAAHLSIEEGASLDIDVDGSLTVTGDITNLGTLHIHSGNSGSGSLIEYGGTVAESEQHIVPGQWHYISSPVTEWNSDIFEGLFLMGWNEPLEAWEYIEELGVPLNSGLHGYGVWAESASTAIYSGVLNSGPFTVEVTNTPGSSNPDNDPSGYNLVGNPYPSSLDWDAEDGVGWTRTATNIALSIYFWNGTQYASYVKGGPNPGPNGGSNIIPPHQGFFVKCLSEEGGLLEVNDAARTHSGQPFYKDDMSEGRFLRMEMHGNELSDELVVFCDSGATAGYDFKFDACKLFGCEEAPQLYTFSDDGTKLSINAIPAFQSHVALPLAFRTGVAGVNELILSEIVGFEDIPVYLEDIYLQQVTDLTDIGYYKFYSEDGIVGDRFILHFFEDEKPVFQNNVSQEAPLVYARDGKVIIVSNKPMTGQVMISDLLGRVAIDYPLTGEKRRELHLNDQHGWVLVRIINNNYLFTRKVFLTN